jgi:hypothetical protein
LFILLSAYESADDSQFAQRNEPAVKRRIKGSRSLAALLLVNLWLSYRHTKLPMIDILRNSK